MKISKKGATAIANIAIAVMLVVLVYVTNIDNFAVMVTREVDKPYYRGNTEKKQVSLMINVYWGGEYIEDMLKIFDKYDFKTTFFLGGCWVAKNYELVKSISEKGHEIGNHGYFHKDHKKLNYQINYDEIAMTNKLIKNYLNTDVKLFAPPSGSFSDTTMQAVKDLDMTAVMWSKDTIDWRDKDSNIVFSRATKNIQNGDLILSHPTKHTLEALDGILKFYKDNGYKCVTVSENIGNKSV